MRRWVLIAILICAFWLRLWRVGELALWYDEASFYWVASKPLPDLIAYTLQSSFEHPPFSFVLYHIWLRLAEPGEFSLRFVAAFFSLLAIPLSWRLARLWVSEREALLVSFIFAFAPFGSCFREARMYPVMLVVSLLSLSIFSSLLKNGYSARGMVCLSIVNILAFLTHYYTIWLVVWEFFWLCVKLQKKREILPYLFAFFVAIIGWYFASEGVRSSVGSLLGQPQRKAFVDVERAFLGVVIGGPLVKPIPLLVKVAVLAVWLVGLGGFGRLQSGLMWLTLVLFSVSASIAFPWSNINPRFFLYVFWPLALSWASQMRFGRSLANRVKSTLVVVLLLPLWSYGWWLHLNLNSTENLYREAVRYLEFMEKPGDRLFLYGPRHWHLLNFYYKGSLTPEKISLEEIRNLKQRAFVLGLAGWGEDPKGEILKALRESTYLAWEKWFSDWVYLGLYYPPVELAQRTSAPVQGNKPGGPFRVFLPIVLNWSGKPLIEGSVRMTGKEFSGGFQFTLTETMGTCLQPYDAIYYDLCPSPSVTPEATEGLFLSLRLYDEAGQLWASGDYPIRKECTRAALVVPWGVPSGLYRAVAQIYNVKEGVPLKPSDGEPWITESIAVCNTWPDKIRPLNPVNAVFGQKVQLLGTDRLPSEVEQGATLPISLYWFFPEGKPLEKLTRIVELRDGKGRLITLLEAVIVNTNPEIPPGLADRFSLNIPGRLQTGEYHLKLKVVDGSGQILTCERPEKLFGKRSAREACDLGKITVVPIKRSFRKPSVDVYFEAEVKGIARLIGYTLDASQARPGGALRLTLFWQAAGEPEKNYTVFNHLVGPDGRIWGQKDNPPARGSRPTTTWLRGEYITDEYLIPISPDAPDGLYTLYTGFYDPQTMERVPAFAANGERLPNDAIPVAKVEITRR